MRARWFGRTVLVVGLVAPSSSVNAAPAASSNAMPIDLEDSRAMVQRWFELIDNGDVAAFGEVLTDDFIFHFPGGTEQARGLEEMRQLSAGHHDIAPNMKHEILDVIAGQDRVVVRYVAVFTFVKEWMGVAPTGKSMRETGILILRVENGKFAEGWFEYDGLGTARELGLLPSTSSK
jgi:ketosteroid isomerase-like protein